MILKVPVGAIVVFSGIAIRLPLIKPDIFIHTLHWLLNHENDNQK